MKKYLAFFAVLGLLVACQGKENPTVSATAISLSKNSLSLQVGVSETLTATLEPANTTDKVVWKSSAEDIASVKDGIVTAVARGTATITAKAGTQTAKCVVVVKNPASKGSVDLGLSVYWASCNVCEDGFVKSPEEYGDFYAWGEIETKEEFHWSTYKLCEGTAFSFTKYNGVSGRGEVDYKSVLEPEDDVAHVKLGGNWRMPTMEEWMELISKCTWEWTAQNGVKGSKVTGPNGNSIFLPAAGYSTGEVGSNIHYWSSSLDKQLQSDAWHVYYFNDGKVHCTNHARCSGCSVRPVSD